MEPTFIFLAVSSPKKLKIKLRLFCFNLEQVQATHVSSKEVRKSGRSETYGYGKDVQRSRRKIRKVIIELML